jgi:hypothetical protein
MNELVNLRPAEKNPAAHQGIGSLKLQIQELVKRPGEDSDQRRFAEAEPLFKRSLAITEKALGPDHPVVAASLEAMARLYRATNREKEAQELESRAARIRSMKR